MNNYKKHEHISISLFRVSSDSKYIDMIFSCPQNYYFTSLQLEVKYYNTSDKKFNSEFFDLSMALFNSDPESEEYNKKHWNVRIPLEKLNIFVPAIYKAVIKAEEIIEKTIRVNEYGFYTLTEDCKNDPTTKIWTENNPPYVIYNTETHKIQSLNYFENRWEDDYVFNGQANIKYFVDNDANGNIVVYEPVVAKFVYNNESIGEELIDKMICSDVNYAYRCMLDDLLQMNNLCDPCVEISDEAIRKYLILYGHQAALSCGDDEVAERYFKLIGNCFSNCGERVSNCGCNKQPYQRSHRNCNCGK